MNAANSALVVLSGGQDSTTCLYWAKARYNTIHALTFDYGQRHLRELSSAEFVALAAGVASHEVVRLGPVLQGTSPLVDASRDVEGYMGAEALPGGIEKTFVPMRNALFLVIAANRAVARGCGVIVTGVSQEDYGGYPDCRAPFIASIERAVNEALGESVPRQLDIVAPLLYLNKAHTVHLARALKNGCWEALAHSHTCYRGEFPPCGFCHACLLRARGFAEAQEVDPLVTRAQQAGEEIHVRD